MRFYLPSVGGIPLTVMVRETTLSTAKKGMFHGKLANEEQTMTNSLKSRCGD